MAGKGRKEPLVLAADVGGTKTHIGFFRMEGNRPQPLVIETHLSREANRLEEIIERFLGQNRMPVQSACIGIAGPVLNGVCRTTNLPWVVSEGGVKRRFKWPHVRMVNDLVATALSIPLLRPREVIALNRERVQRGQNIALLAPGTGTGQAFLVYHQGVYVPLASEGGHVDFGPNSEEEVKLWRYLRSRFGHVSPERIVSGPGLVNIYSWLKRANPGKETPQLKKMLTEMDPGRVITEMGLSNSNPLCSEAVRLFVSVLGSVAGNLALTSTARGGVYLGGGIPPKMLPAIQQETFMQAFTNKGRFSDYMKGIPVRVILNDRAALLGAAHCAFERIK
jgi:glucokinase